MNNHSTAYIEKVLDVTRDYFVEVIREHAQPYSIGKKTIPYSGFPIFSQADNAFYKSQYYEKLLESKIRKMVNIVLFDMFRYYKIHFETPKYSEVRYVNHKNESLEDIIDFQFIVEKDGHRIMYRYSPPCYSREELDALFDDYEIESFQGIDWIEVKDYEHYKREQLGVPFEYRNRVYGITLKQFFLRYFSENEYVVFIKKISEAVKQANDIIGYQTIEQMSFQYLSEYKKTLSEKIRNTDFSALRFHKIDKNTKIITVDNSYFDKKDLQIMNSRFFDDEMYKALIGNESFAKCFITSEYLFDVFKRAGRFDYTAIVCGYIKCVEQLLYKILRIHLIDSDSKELWIKSSLKYNGNDIGVTRRNPKVRNKWQIQMKKKYEKFFDISLAPLCWYLHDNEDCWNISSQSRELAVNFFSRYCQEDRNDNFHKNNIVEFEYVESIRNNTLILLFIILGSCTLTGNTGEDLNLLGAQNNAFEELYKKISEIPRDTFIFDFGDGREIKALKLFDQDPAVYGENGLDPDTVIKFAKVDDYRIDNYVEFIDKLQDEDIITIGVDRVPEKVWFVNIGKGGEKVQLR